MTTVARRPPRQPFKTPRRRPVWWLRGTHRPALA